MPSKIKAPKPKRNGQQIGFYLPAEVIDLLKKMAATENRPVSNMLATLILNAAKRRAVK